MLPFFKKKKIKSTVPLNKLTDETDVLDCLEAVFNRIDNLNYFTLNNKGSNQKSYAFSRYDGLWRCAEDEYKDFKSKSIKEVIEYVERGGDKSQLPVLIKR